MLDTYLRRWRLERLRAIGFEGFARLAVCSAAYLLAVLCLDALFLLPQALRGALYLGGAFALAAGVYFFFLSPLRLLSPPQLFRAVVARHPQLGAYLNSAWELSRYGAPPHTSLELAESHRKQAELLLQALPQEPIFPCRLSRAAIQGLGIVAAAWVLGGFWLHAQTPVWGRVLTPWKDVGLESLLEIRPGDLRTGWGSSVDISAQWRGPGEAGLLLWMRPEEGVWQQVPFDRSVAGTFSFSVQELTQVLSYRFQFRDIKTRAYTLTPLPFPRLTGITVHVRPPGQAPQRPFPLEGSGEIAALRGSWVTLKGRPDQPIRSAALHLSTLNAPVPMKPLRSGEWEGGFPLQENGTLKIDLMSQEEMQDPNPIVYALRALQDEPPSAELLSPAFELEISPKDKLPITWAARDDYGLKSASLIYRSGSAGEVELLIGNFSRAEKDFLGDFAWNLSSLPLGTRIEFWIKATDNARPSQFSVSHKGAIRIVDFEAAHAKTRREWDAAQKSLLSLAEQENALRELLQDMENRPAPSKREALLRSLKEAEAELERRWSSVSENFSGLLQDMRQDAYANPGMKQLAEAISQMLASLRQNELTQARKAASSGQWSESERLHERLESRLRKASELLKDGKEIQVMQDFWIEAQRMDQASSEMERALSALSSGGKEPSAEDLKKLDESLSDLRKQMDALAQALESLPKPAPGSDREEARKMYTVPLRSAQRTAEALQSALKRGDYAEAARAARRLSQQLAQMREALAQAARGASGGESSAARRLEQALALWQEVIDGQSQSLGMTQQMEEDKLKRILDKQKDLLKELAFEQAALCRDGAVLGPTMPAEALSWMREVLKEFEAASVREAPNLLERIITRLKPPRAQESLDLQGIAQREEKIRDRLKQGIVPPRLDEAKLSEGMAAQAVQGQVRRKTADLEKRLDSVSQSLALPQNAVDSVQQAQAEQRAAEQALSVGDSSKALGRQQKALEHLEQGMKHMSEALAQSRSMEQAATQPFERPRGVVRPIGKGGSSGADTGFVPLPDAQQYQPPQEIRREVERSLRERRPRIFKDIVDEYLKRISQ